MIKIDIFSGFLGAGKTTLIKKLISEGYKGEKLVLIENEFGEIGIDGGFLQDAGITVNEMNSGCICCSLVGDFAKALEQVISQYSPDRIVIEPSGVGKLSDVKKAVSTVLNENVVLSGCITVADVNKCKMYVKNFGEFYVDQIENASVVVLSHTQSATDKKISECVSLIREHNGKAAVVTTPWDQISGEQIIEAMETENTLEGELDKLRSETEHHHHHHHEGECHHEHHHEGECHHEHHHEGECHHEHHHEGECHHEHHHEGECHHEHHHEHGEECTCGCHDHHHHHADEVFESWGVESTAKFTAEQIGNILAQLENEEEYGFILRAKGIVASEDGKWIHFDYIPEEPDVRYGSASLIGRICVIGSKINKEKIAALFGV